MIQASTFVSNSTTGAHGRGGGGLYHINGAAAITNTTFSGNSTKGSGGGIYFRDSTMTLNYVTIAYNTADSDNFDPGFGLGSGDGGGLYFENGPDIGNTIIAENSDRSGGGVDCFMDAWGAPMNSLDYNLIQDTTGCGIGGAITHNITGSSPVLGPLQNNGGATDTHALLSGSPAIDAANPADCPATDQRGIARPQGARCDIGAYEATTRFIYLPLVFRNHIAAPDLIVQSVTATADNVQVIIQNIGNAPATDEFWVDVYITPNPVPTAVNQRWDDGRSAQGIAWGVLASALPLQPGGALTLTVSDANYDPIRSHMAWPLPAGTTVYAQADSWNLSTTYGAVLENHEMTGGAYNNITHTVSVSLAGGPALPPAGARQPGGTLPASFGKLPLRP